jgi:hypothetical protein
MPREATDESFSRISIERAICRLTAGLLSIFSFCLKASRGTMIRSLPVLRVCLHILFLAGVACAGHSFGRASRAHNRVGGALVDEEGAVRRMCRTMPEPISPDGIAQDWKVSASGSKRTSASGRLPLSL